MKATSTYKYCDCFESSTTSSDQSDLLASYLASGKTSSESASYIAIDKSRLLSGSEKRAFEISFELSSVDISSSTCTTTEEEDEDQSSFWNDGVSLYCCSLTPQTSSECLPWTTVKPSLELSAAWLRTSCTLLSCMLRYCIVTTKACIVFANNPTRSSSLSCICLIKRRP